MPMPWIKQCYELLRKNMFLKLKSWFEPYNRGSRREISPPSVQLRYYLLGQGTLTKFTHT
ncbi:hypothetical protein HYC85_019290 [Camellia sinensis]|uniref:Uncharacterized protein n=1 Tax=Camellia sinensis TaxID=4442 RepID=A0A7J7GQG6_CAMSI|nr:hypothetical protein HYC85_019290 [Camellia sinensis]